MVARLLSAEKVSYIVIEADMKAAKRGRKWLPVFMRSTRLTALKLWVLKCKCSSYMRSQSYDNSIARSIPTAFRAVSVWNLHEYRKALSLPRWLLSCQPIT